MIAAAMPKPHNSARHGGALKLHRDCGFGGVSIAPLRPPPSANPPIVQNGTALAINYLTSGVAALSASSTGRGGARNRADRESHALTAAQIGNLKAAERHAEIIGLPFTRMISIHWQAAGVPLAGMAKATYRFTDLMAKAQRMAQTQTMQGGDIAVVNLARIFGNLAVFVDPNAAQVAHEYADTISDRLKKELDQAVQTGVLVKVEGWDLNLPQPADVTAKINAVPPLKIPPLPEISRDATAKD